MAPPVLQSNADVQAIFDAWNGGDAAKVMTIFTPELASSSEFAQWGAAMAQYNGYYEQKMEFLGGWFTDKDCLLQQRENMTCVKDGCPSPYLSLRTPRVLKEGEVVSREFIVLYKFDQETGKVKEAKNFVEFFFHE